MLVLYIVTGGFLLGGGIVLAANFGPTKNRRY